MHARIVRTVESHGPRAGRDMTPEVASILRLGAGHRRRDHHSCRDGACHHQFSRSRSHRATSRARPSRADARAHCGNAPGRSGRAEWPTVGDEGHAIPSRSVYTLVGYIEDMLREPGLAPNHDAHTEVEGDGL